MQDLEFTCTQKTARYQDGWDYPEAIEDATDENGIIYNCCECENDNTCNNDDTPTTPDIKGNLICSIYEKTCTTEENHGPNNINDDTGYHKTCTTCIRIIKKYQQAT